MCGIAGIWLKQGGDAARLDRAIAHFGASLQHRGPDAFGVHRSGDHAAFVNLRLAIVDRGAAGNQPFYAPGKRQGIVYNGEVYNWAELRAPLEGRFPFASHTDTEVVLASWLAQGEDALAALNGMFGLCLWDEERESFLLARDRFGAKPLYVYEDEHCIAFASELKALLGLPGLDLSLDPIGFQDYLAFRYNLAPRTQFKRIEKLPAGHLLRFERGQRVALRRFAALEVREPQADRPAADYLDELDALLTRSVRGQLMGEVPIGVLLSGGLDSSSIAAYVHKAGARLKAYSIGFPEVNEFAFSRDVARQYELDYVELSITQDELRSGMDRVLREIDEPIADPACFALSRLCQRIAEDVTVVLSGEGGDELFAGYSHHQLALHQQQLGHDQAFAHFFHQSVYNLEANQWLKDKGQPLQHLRYRPLFDQSDSLLSGMQNFELHTWLPEDLMMKADKIAMAHSLEGRFPFLDNEVFAFAARLPREMKIPAPGASKQVLRQLMARQLPASVVERRKMGFTVPPAFFLAPLHDRLRAAIAALRGTELAEVLDLDEIAATFARYYAGEPLPVFKAWHLAVLLLWWAEVFPGYKPAAMPSFPPSSSFDKLPTPMSPTPPTSAVHHVLCDGGLSNRFNALIFALVLRNKFGGDWRISWPRNNWCGAAFDELFACELPVDELSIEHFKAHEQQHVLLMHENQIGFSPEHLVINRQLSSYEAYAPYFASGRSVVYFNNLIPGFASPEDLAEALQQLRPNAEVERRALEFSRAQGIDAQVLGLHIRKTDFGDKVDDEALFQEVKNSPRRFFVCSDSAAVNERFAALPNCAVFAKTSFPEKLVAEAAWQHWTQDAEGRRFPFNILRPSTAVVEGLIDQLILSRTTIMSTSHSTFLHTAQLFHKNSFLDPSSAVTPVVAPPPPAPERPVTQTDLLELLNLIRPWQMSSDHKVRIGSNADGGYVMPSSSRRSNAVLSIGIGNEVSFDEELAAAGARVLQFDHTIEASPSRHPGCEFHRLGWGARDSHPLVSLASMVKMLDWGQARHPILKFDTEGAEWDCLGQASSDDLARFEVLTGEFHDFHQLVDRQFFDRVQAVFQKLNKTHRVIHLHANNAGGMVMLGGVPFPRLLELTWMRLGSATFHGHSNEPIPGPLDRPNVPQLPDLYLRAF
ncbi:asparagine synthase (glutamine-hydrolyzing) [Roseateles sp. DAIF2]|uniref:asparagine synthase (glutamine-hydrolyzing) n=1 Tax=Roseateles sp. DAIF2 TaxID=2714952 RepID=UPI0018A24ACA|nr:asparagine synthase (glutamine-hydrolyzing) [Roseateles sp. DAIF2]QPF73764.1 asparagine synthase (glutamine-hydrolyzing) [Roseateles sp. DAIF2]